MKFETVCWWSSNVAVSQSVRQSVRPLTVISVLPNYSRGNEADWLDSTRLPVSDWRLKRRHEQTCRPSQLSVCLPRPSPPGPAPLPARPLCLSVKLPGCQTSTNPLPTSSRSRLSRCFSHPQLVGPRFVIFNWQTQRRLNKMGFYLFLFFGGGSQGNGEIRKWFVGRQNLHPWMVILENSLLACQWLIAHLISSFFFFFIGWGKLHFHWQPPPAARWKCRPRE